MGRLEEAGEMYGRALELDPSNDQLQRKLDLTR
jgi:hypothetical protein